MSYTIDDLEKIVNYKTWGNKRKIDTLLEIDCIMYCNMGKDSKETEREITRKNSRKIYNAIKQIDPQTGIKLLQAMD